MRTGLTNNRNVLTATTHRSAATPMYLQYGKDMNIVRRELKVHISHLCYILCTAAEDYYKNNKEKFDFIKYSIEDDRPKTFLMRILI